MEWYFLFVVLILALARNGNEPRLSRLEHKLKVLMERNGIDAAELDAEIDRIEQAATMKQRLAQGASVRVWLSSMAIGGVLGYPVGMAVAPIFGLYTPSFLGFLLWIPSGMAIGLIVGLAFAKNSAEKYPPK